MSNVTLTHDQKELVKKAALECGFKEFDIIAKVGSIKGDNYLGIIHTITVKESNKQKSLYLILKSAHTNEHFRNEAPICQAFKREAYIYDTIIPRLIRHQDEKAISQPFTGVARYYGCCLHDKNESILMQDLKKCDYKLWDRMKPMNNDHITLTFAEYARFHAASLALKHQHPEEFKELTKDMQLSVFEDGDLQSNENKFDTFINVYFQTGLNAVKRSTKAVGALEKMRGNIKKLFEENQTQDKSAFVVLHGDCWCNNMLFKYKDDQKSPAKICFIDWQISKLGSPVLDIAYFFCVCSSKEVFPNFTKYLNVYHQVLSQNLQEFGCDPDELLSFEQLMDEWHKKAWYGVFLAMVVIKLMLTDSEETPNIVDGKDLAESLNFTSSNSSEFETRLCDMVEFMVDNKYI